MRQTILIICLGFFFFAISLGSAQETVSTSLVQGTPDKVYTIAEEMPRFPGCEDSTANMKEKNFCSQGLMKSFIKENLQYPALAKSRRLEGTVIVQFIVEKDGSLSNFELLRTFERNCGVEAMRLVRLMQEKQVQWRPGYMRGEVVRVKYNLPIKFSIN